MSIVQASDFAGKYNISQNVHTVKDLDLYIERYEKVYLIDLLGCELYELFIADLTATTPQTSQNSPYTEIFNEFCIDDECKIIKSEGIKQMLIDFIYFEYVRDQNYKNTISGTVKSNTEVSELVSPTFLDTIFNEAIETYWAIQFFICENSIDYPTYNGQYKRKTSWI